MEDISLVGSNTHTRLSGEANRLSIRWCGTLEVVTLIYSSTIADDRFYKFFAHMSVISIQNGFSGVSESVDEILT
jgi:hypothetical protein